MHACSAFIFILVRFATHCSLKVFFSLYLFEIISQILILFPVIISLYGLSPLYYIISDSVNSIWTSLVLESDRLQNNHCTIRL